MSNEHPVSPFPTVFFREYKDSVDRQHAIDTFDADANKTNLPTLALSLPVITSDSDQQPFVLELADHQLVAFVNTHLVTRDRDRDHDHELEHDHERGAVFAVSLVRTAVGFRNTGLGTRLLRETKEYLTRREGVDVTLVCSTSGSNTAMLG